MLFPFATRRFLLFCKKRIGELWPLCCKLSPFLLAFCVVAEIVIFSVAAAAAAKELFSVLRRGEFNFRSLPPLYSAAVFFVALLDSADSEGTDLAGWLFLFAVVVVVVVDSGLCVKRVDLLREDEFAFSSSSFSPKEIG